MIYADALRIADEWRALIEPCCETDHAWVVGSVRRHKHEVHDVELLGKPILKAPKPAFGDRQTFATPLDRLLFNMCKDGWLFKGTKNGQKAKQFFVNLRRYGIDSLNPFKLELYLMTPPAQWGVGAVIRTGPGSEVDNFSRWCVTNHSMGGGLPDGFKVRHLAVWSNDQLDSRLEPIAGEIPMEMPLETDFLSFVGLDWIEPQYRHVPRGRRV